MNDDVAIKVEGLHKDFRLPHEKNSSIKQSLLSALRPGHLKIEQQHALKDISFEIKKGEFFGIVGRNGSGKSTLLKILAGIYQPTKGNVQVNGRLVPFIELGVGFNPELSGRENVFLNGALLGFSEKEITEMYEKIVEFAELEKFMDQKLKNYSSGMQVRLAFSIAIRADSDILLIDEVLAVGDTNFQKKCLKYFKSLKDNKKTVVFVTHDMQSMQEYCDRAIVIMSGNKKFLGNTFDAAKSYSLENSRTQKPTKRDTASISDIVTVESCIFSDQKRITNTFYYDVDRINIEIELLSKEDIDRAVIGFAIMDINNNPIVAANTKDLGFKFGELKKNNKKKFMISIQNIFNDSDFSLRLNIKDYEGKFVYGMHKDVGRFSVTGRKNTYGVAHPKITIGEI